MDGTGLEKSKVSQHYIKRIDGNRQYIKAFHFGIIVGENSKILSLRIRRRFTHDITDARYLAKGCPANQKLFSWTKGMIVKNFTNILQSKIYGV